MSWRRMFADKGNSNQRRPPCGNHFNQSVFWFLFLESSDLGIEYAQWAIPSVSVSALTMVIYMHLSFLSPYFGLFIRKLITIIGYTPCKNDLQFLWEACISWHAHLSGCYLSRVIYYLKHYTCSWCISLASLFGTTALSSLTDNKRICTHPTWVFDQDRP